MGGVWGFGFDRVERVELFRGVLFLASRVEIENGGQRDRRDVGKIINQKWGLTGEKKNGIIYAI